MNFMTAVKTCLVEKYITVSGRAARSEYWWFVLFVFAVGLVLQLIGGDVLSGIFGLAVLLPGIAVAVRRLHDLDRTGWWNLLVLIPLIGALVLIFFFFIHRGTAGPNRFGPDPLAGRG